MNRFWVPVERKERENKRESKKIEKKEKTIKRKTSVMC
jgi:hypothetical protein